MTNALFTVLNILGLRQNFLQHLSEADIATLMLVSKQCRELLTEEILSLPGWKHQNNFKIVPAPHGQFFLFKSGLLYAQGTNVDGHLGLEGIRSFDMPTLVNLPADERVIDVQHVYTSNSVYHNTSRTFILTKKGHVYSCGSKGSELGYSLEKNVSSPKKILFPQGTIISRMITSKEGNFFITATGQLFHGQNFLNSLEVNGRSEFATPVRIYLPTGEKVIDVVKNDRSSLILTTNGNVYLYGFNFAWQFSPSKEMYLHKPMKINLPDHAKITSIAISTGEYDNRYCIYLLTENRDVFVLGSNPWGQLGLGHPKDVYVPTKVNFYNNEKIKAIKAYDHNVFFVSIDDDIYVCGRNGDGVLGLGHCDPVMAPTKIPFSKNEKIADIFYQGNSLGAGRAFFISTRGNVYFSGRDYVVDKQGRRLKKHDESQAFDMLGQDVSKKYSASLTKINFPKNTKIVSIGTFNEGSYFISENGDVFVVGKEKFLSYFDIEFSRFAKLKNKLHYFGPVKSSLENILMMAYVSFEEPIKDFKSIKQRLIVVEKNEKDGNNQFYLRQKEDQSLQLLTFPLPKENNPVISHSVSPSSTHHNCNNPSPLPQNQHLIENDETSEHSKGTTHGA